MVCRRGFAGAGHGSGRGWSERAPLSHGLFSDGRAEYLEAICNERVEQSNRAEAVRG